MRTLIAGAVLAACSGTAMADQFADARYADGNDYAGRVYYSLDFGGAAESAHSVGLRFDNMVAAQRGGPALFQAGFTGAGVPSVKLMGGDITGAVLVAGQDGGGGIGGIFSNLSPAQLIGIGFTGIVFTAITIEAVDGTDDPAGSGGS